MSTGQSFGYSQPSYSSFGSPFSSMGGYGQMGGYNSLGGFGGFGGMGGGFPSFNYAQPSYGGSMYSPYMPAVQPSYSGFDMFAGGSSSFDPFAGNYGMGQNYGMSQPNPFGSGYGMSSGNPFGTSFGGMGMGGGFNQFGGFGQVGLGYLPPPQQTINDTVANQFMQQYYGGAFGLGGQPQQPQMRQQPRNPFRGLRGRSQQQPQLPPSTPQDLDFGGINNFDFSFLSPTGGGSLFVPGFDSSFLYR